MEVDLAEELGLSASVADGLVRRSVGLHKNWIYVNTGTVAGISLTVVNWLLPAWSALRKRLARSCGATSCPVKTFSTSNGPAHWSSNWRERRFLRIG